MIIKTNFYNNKYFRAESYFKLNSFSKKLYKRSLNTIIMYVGDLILQFKKSFHGNSK